MTISGAVRLRSTLILATIFAVAGVMLAAVPAQAASWQTVNRLHGAVLQVCSVPVDGKLRVRVRLDNRRANHAHVGGVSSPDGRSRNLRVAPGRAAAAALVVSRNATVSVGLGETNGQGSGDVLPARSFRRC